MYLCTYISHPVCRTMMMTLRMSQAVARTRATNRMKTTRTVKEDWNNLGRCVVCGDLKEQVRVHATQLFISIMDADLLASNV